MITLRDYQQDAVDNLRKCIPAGPSLLVLPTGGGKTIVFTHITELAVEKGTTVLIVVHRQELMYQTSDTLKKFGIDHGLISPKHKQNNKRVQVAMVQTLQRRLDRTEKPNLLIVDEAHHSTAGAWNTVIGWAKCHTIGVTATPCRLDGSPLGSIYKKMVIGTNTADLISRGYLSDYRCFSIPMQNTQKLHVRMGDYVRAEVEEIANKVVGDVVEHWERLAKDEPTIVFCSSIAIADKMADIFNDAGHNFKTLNGSMNHEYRKSLIAGLADGTITGLTTCDVVSEGTDIPVASCAIMLRKTKSTSLYLQQAGRVLRPVDGKVAKIIDHVGNVFEHGLPCEPREWSLESRAKPKKDANESIKECPECFAIMPKNYTNCPECGAEIVSVASERAGIEFVKGKLVEVERWKKPKGFADSYKKFCAETGRKEGLAYYRSKAYTAAEVLFGTDPSELKPKQWKEVQEYLGDHFLPAGTFARVMKEEAHEYKVWLGEIKPLKVAMFENRK